MADRRESESLTLQGDRERIQTAILRTVAYADVFDYPLTVEEVHRYLHIAPASLSVVQDVLSSGKLMPHFLDSHRGFVSLAGRKSIVETRLQRAARAAQMWPKAVRYGSTIASLPFVRMVAVTGTLAMDNVDLGADIDYLIVTDPGRLWLARSLSVALVHVGHMRGVHICPNYLLTLDGLAELDRSLFTAHELAQMRPLYGLSIYHQLVLANGWVQDYLPNAFAKRHIRTVRDKLVWRGLKQGTERLLSGKLGDLWERRESTVKIRRLRDQAWDQPQDAAQFTPQLCKGHLDDHGSRIARAYMQRLVALGLDVDGRTR
jgi:hypothetical protein